jgi:hypothetical protein
MVHGNRLTTARRVATKDPLSPSKLLQSPPKDQLSPPKDQLSPPKDQLSPPKDQLSPPKDQLSPPKDHLSPPSEPEPRLHGLFPDDQTTLTDLPLGVLLTVTIIAHNASGDGPESAPATITLS